MSEPVVLPMRHSFIVLIKTLSIGQVSFTHMSEVAHVFPLVLNLAYLFFCFLCLLLEASNALLSIFSLHFKLMSSHFCLVSFTFGRGGTLMSFVSISDCLFLDSFSLLREQFHVLGKSGVSSIVDLLIAVSSINLMIEVILELMYLALVDTSGILAFHVEASFVFHVRPR